MAEVGQVMPDNQVDLGQDHRMALAMKNFDQSKNEATGVAPKVKTDGFAH